MKIIVDVHSAISDKLLWIPFSNLTSADWLQLSSCFSSKASRDWIYRFISDPSPFCIHTRQLSRIIRESHTYDTNLPVSRTGHHISRIKSSLEFFCALVWDLAHFSSKLEFFLFLVRFLGHFCTYLVTDKDYFWHQRWSRILMVCTSRETSYNHPWVSEWVGAVTCEQALPFGRAKRVSRLRANEWWSREGPRTRFLGPLLARFRETRFARLNRRACSEAIGAAAGWCNNYILTTKTERGSEWRFGREEGGRFYPLLTY